MSDTNSKWAMGRLLRNADRTRPPAEVIHMGPRLGPKSLDDMARDIMEAMRMVRVAKDEEARAQGTLEEMETQRRAREQELCELQEQMWHEVQKLGVLSGPPPTISA